MSKHPQKPVVESLGTVGVGCGLPPPWEELVIETGVGVGITPPGSPTYRLDIKDGGSVDSFGQPSPDEVLLIDKHPKELGVHGIGTPPVKPE